MEEEDRPNSAGVAAPLREARVGLLIPTHALPVLSYRIPDSLDGRIRPGAAVVAPLSGHSRLGVVVEVAEEGAQSREFVRNVVEELSIPQALARVCCELSESFAVPLPSVLRAALVPGLNTGRYRILALESGWPWEPGSVISRAALRRALGGEEMRAAEDAERIEFVAAPPEQKRVEWARTRPAADPDLGRAPRQRELYDFLAERDDGCRVSAMLSETGVARSALRELVRRGAVRIEERPNPPPVLPTTGVARVENPRKRRKYLRDAGRAVDRGGAWSWRVSTREQPSAVAAFVEAAVEGGEQVLVLTPETETADRLAEYLAANLPAGHTVASYHSGLAERRAAIYEELRSGNLDVLVGTRTAAMMPLQRPGAICILDEPNGAHRAGPGYEGLPVHTRDIALERCRTEDCSVLLLSPFPSLRVSALVSRVKELPAPARKWPAARIVDMRGSGAILSSALVDICRESVEQGKQVAVVAGRTGYAMSISCSHCGTFRRCPDCASPLTVRESSGTLKVEILSCVRCGYREESSGHCAACGSGRLRPAGLTVDRVREEVSRALGIPTSKIGKLTSESAEREDAPVVVATARFVIGGDWEVVAVPDADLWLSGSGMGAAEQAFRLLYGASEAARDRILAQTRQPEHQTLRAALRGDYPAFAAAELSRLRDLGYPPYGHLAALVLEGKKESVRRAVESQLRPSLESKVSMSDPIPLVRPGDRLAWKILLRAPDQRAAARVGALAARLAAKTRGANGLVARVEIDPEEV